MPVGSFSINRIQLATASDIVSSVRPDAPWASNLLQGEKKNYYLNSRHPVPLLEGTVLPEETLIDPRGRGGDAAGARLGGRQRCRA